MKRAYRIMASNHINSMVEATEAETPIGEALARIETDELVSQWKKDFSRDDYNTIIEFALDQLANKGCPTE